MRWLTALTGENLKKLYMRTKKQFFSSDNKEEFLRDLMFNV